MLEVPPGCSADNVERLADWVEATALRSGDGVSKFELMESLVAAGLVLPPDESFEEDRDEYEEDDSDLEETAEETLERVADDILACCAERAIQWEAGYPFRVEPDVLELRSGSEIDGYAFLLIADLGHHYSQLKNAIIPDAKSGRLMEKVVEASLCGLFGRGQRFGWPKEPAWPTAIEERVRKLGELLDLRVEDLSGKTDPSDKDRTLDVVGLFMVGASADATLAVFVQCAAGENWKTKLGDPSIEAWANLLQWNCTPVRAIALPWRLGGRQSDWSYTRIYSMSNGAMVLDRPRLLAGRPDIHMDTSVRLELANWWTTAVGKLPFATV